MSRAGPYHYFTIDYLLIDYHYLLITVSVETGFIVLTVLSTKQRNALAANLLHKLMIFETNC